MSATVSFSLEAAQEHPTEMGSAGSVPEAVVGLQEQGSQEALLSPQLQCCSTLSPELQAIKLRFPWINDRWFNEKSPKTGRVFSEVIAHFIMGESQKPLEERALGTNGELCETGYYVPYDRAVEKILNTLAEKYKLAGKEGLKVADLGCGPGVLAILMAFVTDGTKPFTVCCVDGIAINIELLQENFKKFKVSFPFENVFYKHMVKKNEDLSNTNFFGKAAEATFDCIVMANVLYFASFNQKAAILSHVNRLLKTEGVFMFTHMEVNTSYIVDLRSVFDKGYEPGIYRSTSLIKNNGDRAEVPDSLEKCEGDDFWKDVSMQEFVREVKPGKYIKTNLSEMRSIIPTIPQGEVMHVLQVMEVVSPESLVTKCQQAGLVVLEIMGYDFDDTSFLGERPNVALSFFVLATK